MLSWCEFIEEVPYNLLLLTPYHNQQLLKLEKLIADKYICIKMNYYQNNGQLKNSLLMYSTNGIPGHTTRASP